MHVLCCMVGRHEIFTVILLRVLLRTSDEVIHFHPELINIELIDCVFTNRDGQESSTDQSCDVDIIGIDKEWKW